ncbi:hypothetical protein [Nitrosomonas ureae]|uniref:hypothetical protein n=1 Tax=Nitrosomonas ureae TaxID=44577 RepID=UPI000D2FD132|nr:hypothetical protein [Nitrosomonas ureae]
MNTVTSQSQGGIEKLAGGNGLKIAGRVDAKWPARAHSWPLRGDFRVKMAALSATTRGAPRPVLGQLWYFFSQWLATAHFPAGGFGLGRVRFGRNFSMQLFQINKT